MISLHWAWRWLMWARHRTAQRFLWTKPPGGSALMCRFGINFLTRISARYSRLIAEPVAKLAGEVIDHAEKANSIYPSDDQRRQLRKAHLLEARASLMALDVRLTHCYLIMTQNPQGCFTTPSGKSVDAKKATERLDKMAQKLGELIDKENDLLQGMIGTVNRKA